ncbi:MAG: hypothetical protein COA70_05490 [Planctomycetota bacterium]|nr:MAG: hypothetical protein COA70_05490 [Planctomycetota bacterium]
MTDWLDEILDRDTPESVPEGFLERVIVQAKDEEASSQQPSGGRLISFPQLMSMTAAAVMLLAVGFWMGQGGENLHAPAVLGNGPENAMLDLDELYLNREVLEAYDVLSDDDLNSAFYDAESGTWALDYALEDQAK